MRHLWLVLILLLSSFAMAHDLPVTFTAPSTRSDSCHADTTKPLTNLSHVRIEGRRVLDLAFVSLGTLGLPGREGDSVSLVLDLDDATAGLIRAIAVDASGSESCPSEGILTFVTPFDTSGVPGLLGKYYSGINFGTFVMERTDSMIDFDWGFSSPPGLPVDYFSVRWTGRLLIVQRGTWTLCMSQEDGARLWLDGVLWLDDWVIQNEHETCWTGALEPGAHDIRIEYFHNRGHAAAHLRWDGPVNAKEAVPMWGVRH